MRCRRSGPLGLCWVAVFLLLPASLLAHSGFDPYPLQRVGEAAEPLPNDILLEDFEGDWPPPGWALFGTPGDRLWSRSGSKQHSGLYSAWVRYGPEGLPLDQWMVTPALDFSAQTRVYLEFYEDQQYWAGFGGVHSIAVSTTDQADPGAFTPLVEWTPADHVIEGFKGNAVFLDLSDYADEPTVYLAFRYEGTWADNWFVDDLRIYFPDQLDATVLKVLPDDAQYEPGSEILPRTVVSNLGSSAQEIPLLLEIERSGTPIYTCRETLLVQPAAQDTITCRPLILAGGEYYRISAETLLEGDMNPGNDLKRSFIDTYQEDHVPLGYLHTNVTSTPSFLGDTELNGVMEGVVDELALIRVHTWWPGEDPFYEANPEQCDSLIEMAGLDYVPHFWVDGVVDGEFNVSEYAPLFQERSAVKSPFRMAMAWDEENDIVLLRLETVNPIDPEGDWRVRVAVTEDSLFHDGGNGLLEHQQVFRVMLPSVAGLEASPTARTQTFSIPCPLDPSWVQENLRLTAFIQETTGGRVWQSVTGRPDALRPRIQHDPAVSTVAVGQILDLPIVIQPGSFPVKGTEIVVQFDPAVVELLSVEAGDWFTDSGYDSYFYDYTGDQPLPVELTHFSAALLDGSSSDSGVLAICHFMGLAEGITPLTFLDADVRGPGNEFLGYGVSTRDSIRVSQTGTAADEVPAGARALSVSPNPFNPWTRIAYELPRNCRVELAVYDVRGRELRRLLSGSQPAGVHQLSWRGLDDRGRELPSGLYLIRLQAGDRKSCVKALLLR